MIRTSETVQKITTAIAAVQHAIPPIEKNKTVKVDGEKARWESAYATLSTLADAAKPHLRAHGIAKIQAVGHSQGLGPVLVTRLALEDEWIEGDYPIKPSRDGAQGFGGGISFAKRWAICGLLDIVPDDIEEGLGYRDAQRESKAPRRTAAPGGLSAMLDAIRDADTLANFEKAARAARAAHPSGEASAAVEKAITSRIVVSIDNADTPDKLAVCRDAHGRIQARGSEVRDAIGRAERRMRGEV